MKRKVTVLILLSTLGISFLCGCNSKKEETTSSLSDASSISSSLIISSENPFVFPSEEISSITKVNVTYKDGESIYKTETVNEGEEIILSSYEGTLLDNMEFLGWDYVYQNEVVLYVPGDKLIIHQDIILSAHIEEKKYKVVFTLEDNSTKELILHQGETIPQEEIPSFLEEATPGYEKFWLDENGNNVPETFTGTENLYFHVQEIGKLYTVNFIFDGNVIKTCEVRHGEKLPSFPENISDESIKIKSWWAENGITITENQEFTYAGENKEYNIYANYVTLGWIEIVNAGDLNQVYEGEDGEEFVFPEVSSKEDKTFAGWRIVSEEEFIDEESFYYTGGQTITIEPVYN